MGYFILINYQNNDAEAEKTLQLVQEKGSNGELMKFDVTDPAAITLALGNWASQHPDEYIEVLINNAGIRKDNLMLWMTGEEWSKVLDISLNGFFNVTQPLLKNMLVKRLSVIFSRRTSRVCWSATQKPSVVDIQMRPSASAMESTS